MKNDVTIELKKALVWFSKAHRRLKARERIGSIPRYVEIDYETSRNSLIHAVQAKLPNVHSDHVAERVRALEKEFSDLGSKIPKEK